MKRAIQSQAGYTLVEVLAATAITGVLIVVVMTFFANSVVSTTVDSARSDLFQQAQLGLDQIGRDIRLSASADENNRWQDSNAPSAPSNLFSWQSTSSTPFSTLVLATSATDSSKNMLFQDPLNYVTYKNNVIYFVKNGTLYRRVLAATVSGNAAKTSCPAASASASCPADRKLMENATAFKVKYVDSDNKTVTPVDARSIEVTVTLHTTKYRHDITASYTTRMVFRNE